MTTPDRDSYRAAWAAQAKIAAQRRLVINHVVWRDGIMDCQMVPPTRPEPIAEERPSSSRGVMAQERLL